MFDLVQFKDKIMHRFDMIYRAEGMFSDKLKLYKRNIVKDEFIIDTKKGKDSI
ncbi:MAG: hypothetical protein LBG15_02545 [Dysgonamonadaceae bacterium]|jgi:hypothetical protein|nr:hypothetical protein [Dysgonamonadaceae bacterium]